MFTVVGCDAEGDQSFENNFGAALWTAAPRLVFFLHFFLEWIVAWHYTSGPWFKGLEEKGMLYESSLIDVLFL